jgi:hypothetical protein
VRIIKCAALEVFRADTDGKILAKTAQENYLTLEYGFLIFCTAGGTMRKIITLISLLVSLGLALFLWCSSPTNPFTDYSSCSVTFLVPGQDDTVWYAKDTLPVTIKIEGASLFSVLTLYIDSTDSTTVTSFGSSWTDTITVYKVFEKSDTVDLVIKAVLQNKGQLQKTVRIFIAGRPPVITREPPEELAVQIGAICSVSVAAEGILPLSYQWTQNGSLRAADTTAQLYIGNFQASDSGLYRCIVKNDWGSDTSRSIKLTVKERSGKPVFWNFAFYRDTVKEGDTLIIRLDSLYTAPASDTVSFALVEPESRASFAGDSIFTFYAGARDSGSYMIPVSVSSKSGADTGVMAITVIPTYCTLKLVSDSGSIVATPAAAKYRWSDTVSLKAVPDTGFIFFQWSGDISGITDSISLVILHDLTVQARFIPKDSSGCVEITSGSLNQAIRDASPGSKRPRRICPAPGAYDQGTIKIWGAVRIEIQ